MDSEDDHRSNSATQRLLDYEHDFSKRVSSAWEGFTGFILRDNVLEVALGLMLVVIEHCPDRGP